ncbi:MAG: Cysteine desulfurase [Parcubacteria group bacterium GW2011_GWA2_47_16]|nr:MAG: Cysteine desulfurase [Parcubacteria group bacterium GW2011_GWA2_47_16]
MAKRIYMDYASTTPLDPRVLKAMLPYFGEKFGNPSSIHAEGVEAKKALEAARKNVGLILNARANEIFFTGGGTESNNLAIFGIVRALEKTGVSISKMHFVTTVIEHSSILECFRELESRGAKVAYAPVRENGIVDPTVIAKLLQPKTVLVSVGYANNEIGTIQPIREISKIIRAQNFPTSKLHFKTFFHSDASQAPLYLDCSVERLGVDLLTLDGHKMYGPKGVGALYVRRSVTLVPILFGGGQEKGLRSTTENLPLIVGFAKALEVAAALLEKESARLTTLRDFCYSNILKNVGMTKVIINGDIKERLPNNINISIPKLDTEFALLQLDAAGIACSTKSSCLGSEGGSYVVRALGGGETRAASTLRFTFGRATTKKDISLLLKHLFRIIG